MCVIKVVDDDWRQFGGPSRNFQRPAEVISPTTQVVDKNTNSLLRAWTHRINVGDASPVTRRDLVYVICADFDDSEIGRAHV